ncbi:MAG: TIGR03663 family protein, partial [Anaerolineales bacterium]
MSASAEASDKMTRRSSDAWKVVYIIILILAVFTRLIWLGERAVSHDETTHAKYSWNLYSGRGFRHDPLMHGPLLFEATSLFYFLFGVSDFTARLYAALAGIALVISPVLLRKWLGRWGALIASLLLLISPAITYYSRYTRHDIPIILTVVLFLWSVFSYLEDGKTRWLYLMAGFFALMYASKENAYIYTAIFLILLATPFIKWLLSTPWSNPTRIKYLIPLLVIALIAGGLFILSFDNPQVIEAGEGNNDIGGVIVPGWGRIALLLAFTSMIISLLVVVQGVGRDNFKNMRLFDVLMVVGTLTLPLGSALMMKFMAGVDMTQFYSGMMALNFNTMAIGSVISAFAMLFIMLALSVFLGLWWDRHRWPGIAIAYYAIFFILYSSIFTWGWGMVTGLVGGLAYWIAQQDVQRGSQPWYYYGIVGPMYEYLPILFSLLAVVPAIGWLFRPGSNAETESGDTQPGERNLDFSRDLSQRYVPFFLLVWALLSWIAYAIAGEKMPWLFVHIAFPHILLAAWGLGRWLQGLTWEDFTQQFGWLVPVSLFFLWMAARAFRKSSGALQAIQETLAASGASDGLSRLLAQLDPLARFIGGIGGVLLCTMLLVWALDRSGLKRAFKLLLLSLLIIIGGLTVRTMIMLNYINPALAKEFLVYAHATPDVRLALDEIEELSWRLTGTSNEI